MAEWAKAWIAQTLEILESTVGVAPEEPLSDPLGELIACILSQHTTDAASIPAFHRLRERFQEWADLANAPNEMVVDVIRGAGLANQKARSIKHVLHAVHNKVGAYDLSFLRELPLQEAQDYLESLPGVGPKTAAIVLCFALGRDVVPVDTHVYRVGVRLGWIPEVGAAKAHVWLNHVTPEGLARRLHLALINHGRTCCTARNPHCSGCLLRERCPHPDPASRTLRERLKSSSPSLEEALGWIQRRGSRVRLQLLTLRQYALRRARNEEQIGYSEGLLASAWPRTLRRKSNLSAPLIEVALRERIDAALGPNSRTVASWVNSQPDSGALWVCLAENEEAMHRVTTLSESAPALIQELAKDAPFTRALFGADPSSHEETLSFTQNEPPGSVAIEFRRAANRLAAKWVLHPSSDLGTSLSNLYDQLLQYLCGRLCLNVDVLAMGTYGTQDLTLGSDLDLAILARSDSLEAHSTTVSFLAFCSTLEQAGAPLRLDFGIDSMLRSRSEAPIRSYDGLRQYELESMSMAERFGLGHARSVWGDPEAARLLQKAAYAVPLTPERLRELVASKRRHESENVLPKHRRRDVKRGIGGLGDLEWFVHLHELRFPTATLAGSSTSMDQRIRNIASARLINTVECEELLEARRHLLEVRHRLVLLGLTRDVVPENPFKLARLAREFGQVDGNDFLSLHERVTSRVRSIYEDGLERLNV